jgi:uncharacterized protein YdeI (YjbR/CyaY-like superfamily)
LENNEKAKAFYKTLSQANASIVYRLQTAKKPETRKKRMKLVITMLEQGKAFQPQSQRL